MQSLFLKPSPKTNGKRLGRILTEHAIGAPTPVRKSYKCIYEPGNMCPRCDWKIQSSIRNLVPICQEYCFFDGHCTRGTSGIYPRSEDLLLFLETVTQQYKLTDFEALFLLQFFKSNIKEACRQLCDERNTMTLTLSIDTPWQLQPKAICQQPGIKQFSMHTFFKNDKGNTFSKRPHLWRSILMQETILGAAVGSHFRVQRAIYRGHTIQVACILAGNNLSFRVVGLLLPSVIPPLADYGDLVHELEMYLISLISASNVWDVSVKKMKSTVTSDELNLRYGSMQWHKIPMPLDGKTNSINNDPLSIVDVKYYYALLRTDKNKHEKTAV